VGFRIPLHRGSEAALPRQGLTVTMGKESKRNNDQLFSSRLRQGVDIVLKLLSSEAGHF
jgi:hypothetical protein